MKTKQKSLQDFEPNGIKVVCLDCEKEYTDKIYNTSGCPNCGGRFAASPSVFELWQSQSLWSALEGDFTEAIE